MCFGFGQTAAAVKGSWSGIPSRTRPALDVFKHPALQCEPALAKYFGAEGIDKLLPKRIFRSGAEAFC